jgi:hypothetical protein
MTTIGDATSRVRNVLKAVKEDPFVTDRFLYSMIMKYAKLLIYRQDQKGNLKEYTGLFEAIPCLDLIEVDKIEACCLGIKTGCTFRRTKDPLPEMVDGGKGPVIRSVTTIDQSIRLEETYPELYANLSSTTTFKYLTTKYFWFIGGHIYIPDVEWENIRVVALWDSDVTKFDCTKDSDICLPAQDRKMPVPENLFAEIEQMVLKEILTSGQLPSDGADDGQNVLR